MRKSHLHPSMETPIGMYRRIPTGSITALLSARLMRQINGSGIYRRIIEVDEQGDFHTVGVLIPLPKPKEAIRVLYTFADLFRVERIRWDDETFTTQGIEGNILAPYLAEAVAFWSLDPDDA